MKLLLSENGILIFDIICIVYLHWHFKNIWQYAGKFNWGVERLLKFKAKILAFADPRYHITSEKLSFMFMVNLGIKCEETVSLSTYLLLGCWGS